MTLNSKSMNVNNMVEATRRLFRQAPMFWVSVSPEEAREIAQEIGEWNDFTAEGVTMLIEGVETVLRELLHYTGEKPVEGYAYLIGREYSPVLYVVFPSPLLLKIAEEQGIGAPGVDTKLGYQIVQNLLELRLEKLTDPARVDEHNWTDRVPTYEMAYRFWWD